jgi:hypothetical protein
MVIFRLWGPPFSQTRGAPNVGCLQLITQYVCYLDIAFCIWSLRAFRAVTTVLRVRWENLFKVFTKLLPLCQLRCWWQRQRESQNLWRQAITDTTDSPKIIWGVRSHESLKCCMFRSFLILRGLYSSIYCCKITCFEGNYSIISKTIKE